MKISEFNQPKKVDEGIGDALGGMSRALVGDYATSAIKGMFTGQGTKAQLTQDLFMKDFINDAIASLKNGISSGVVDPNLGMSGSAVTDTDDSNTSSAKEKNPGDTAQAGPAGGGEKPGAEPINKAYGQVVGAMRNVQSGTKPITPEITAAINKDIQNARYNKDWAINTGNKIVALANKGYDVSALKKAWDSSTAIGRKQGTVQESWYKKLDTIFESIIREQETGGAKSIGEYMLDWFTAYMAGTNWESYKPSIMKIIKSIEDSYGSDKGRAGIKTLAKAAFSIPGASGAKGAENAVPAGSNAKKKATIDFGAGGPGPDASSDVMTQINTIAKNPEAAAAMRAWVAKNAK